MKIIHITASYKPAYIYGGPIQSIGKLCEALEDFNAGTLEIEVLTTTANGQTELDIEPNVQTSIGGVSVTFFKRLTKDHTHFSPGLLKKMGSILKKKLNKPLVIHIHAWWNLVSVLSCLIAKRFHVPVVLSPRGMLTSYTFGNRNSRSKSFIHRFIGKSLLQYCHVHATSEQEKSDILKIINPKSITVIPNLVNFPESINQSESTIHSPFFKLIFLSRIEEKKGLELLFDALSNLTINWTLSIAGAGEQNYIVSLKHKIKSLNISERITWLGHVSNEEKFEILANHDLMVLPSYNENFANVVIESLSVGTPVLVSEFVGLSDYVIEQKLGWVCHLNKIDLASQISNAFEHTEFRNNIRNQAPLLIRTDFNSKVLIQDYISLYNQVILV